MKRRHFIRNVAYGSAAGLTLGGVPLNLLAGNPALKYHYDLLIEAALSFPQKDADPRYVPNPPQEWDVEISAESQVWKK